jgi:hypothetical protein
MSGQTMMMMTAESKLLLKWRVPLKIGLARAKAAVPLTKIRRSRFLLKIQKPKMSEIKGIIHL